MDYSLMLVTLDKPGSPEDIFLCYQMLGWGLWEEFAKLSHVSLRYQDPSKPLQKDPVDFMLIHMPSLKWHLNQVFDLRKIVRKKVISFLEFPLRPIFADLVDYDFTYLQGGSEQIPFPYVSSLLKESTSTKIQGSILLDHSWNDGECWNERLWEWLEPLKKTVGQLRRLEHERGRELPSWICSIPKSNYCDYLKNTAEYETFILTHPGTYEHSIIDMVHRGIRVLMPIENGRTFAPAEIVRSLGLETFSSRNELLSLLEHPVKNNRRKSVLTDMPEVVRRIDAYCQRSIK